MQSHTMLPILLLVGTILEFTLYPISTSGYSAESLTQQHTMAAASVSCDHLDSSPIYQVPQKLWPCFTIGLCKRPSHLHIIAVTQPQQKGAQSPYRRYPLSTWLWYSQGTVFMDFTGYPYVRALFSKSG